MLSKLRPHVFFIAALALAAFFGTAPLARASYNLEDAIKAGLLSVSGFASSGYSETTLTIFNKAVAAVDIEFSTVCFVQNNESQRVGLAYEKSTGGYLLRFAAGKQYPLRFIDPRTIS